MKNSRLKEIKEILEEHLGEYENPEGGKEATEEFIDKRIEMRRRIVAQEKETREQLKKLAKLLDEEEDMEVPDDMEIILDAQMDEVSEVIDGHDMSNYADLIDSSSALEYLETMKRMLRNGQV